MAFLQKLFDKRDPLEEKADNLVPFCRIMATQMFIPVIEQFKFVGHSKPEDWDFFATVASVHVALNGLTAKVGAERFKSLYPIIAEHVRKLDKQGEAALEDCQKFVMRSYDKNNADHNIATLGLWVLWNVLRRQPTREEMNAAPGIGHVLAEPFLGWWEWKGIRENQGVSRWSASNV
jgi:hypothetical protein